MEKFILTIDLDGQTFEYNTNENIALCLERVAKLLRGGIPSYAVYDAEGYKVGRFDIVDGGVSRATFHK